MITLEQTVEIPADRRLYLELPKTVPSGQTKITLNFEPPVPQPVAPGKRKLSPELQAAIKEAGEKRAWRFAHPEEFEERMKKAREGGPLFGGIDGLEYQRKVRSEWEDRLG
jgi:hypothetical protein